MTTPLHFEKLRIPFPVFLGVIAGLTWLLGIAWLGYIARQTQFYHILAGYAIAFGAFGWLLSLDRNVISMRFLVILAVSGRLMLFGSVPLLSDDIYRFLWDGLRWLDGGNAYLGIPTNVITLLAREPAYAKLYPLLNSPDYYTIYPPILQFLFIPAAQVWRSTGSLIWSAGIIRLCFMGGDLLAWIGMKKLHIPDRRRLWYFLNPLVTVEIFGNLHAEGVMVGLLALATGWLLGAKTTGMSGMAFAGSVSTKLTTAVFGPLLLLTLPPRKRQVWLVAALGITLLVAWPILMAVWQGGFLESLDLYFRKFEFNAGLYYLIRQIGWQIAGFNPIGYVGPALGILGMATVLIIATRSRKSNLKNAGEAMLWTLMAYLLTTTTLHPWYLITLVFLGVLTTRRFPIAWSFLVVLSYSHYLHGNFHERFGWIALEYGLLLVAMIREYRGPKK